jgi:hypothetical protein
MVAAGLGSGPLDVMCKRLSQIDVNAVLNRQAFRENLIVIGVRLGAIVGRRQWERLEAKFLCFLATQDRAKDEER